MLNLRPPPPLLLYAFETFERPSRIDVKLLLRIATANVASGTASERRLRDPESQGSAQTSGRDDAPDIGDP